MNNKPILNQQGGGNEKIKTSKKEKQKEPKYVSEYEIQEKKTTQEFKKIEEDYKNCIDGGQAQNLLGKISSSNYPWYDKSFTSNQNSITVSNIAGNLTYYEDKDGNNVYDDKGELKLNPNHIEAKHEAIVKSHGFETKIMYKGSGRFLIPTNRNNKFLIVDSWGDIGDCLYYVNQLALLMNYLKSMTTGGGGKLVLVGLNIEIEKIGFNPTLVSHEWITGILSGIQGPKKKVKWDSGDETEEVNGRFGYFTKEYDEYGKSTGGNGSTSNSDSFPGSEGFNHYGKKFLEEIIEYVRFNNK